MVERRSELNRRYQRKKKLAKLKARLATAKEGRERDQILAKIKLVSPWWKPAALLRHLAEVGKTFADLDKEKVATS